MSWWARSEVTSPPSVPCVRSAVIHSESGAWKWMPFGAGNQWAVLPCRSAGVSDGGYPKARR